MLERKIGARHGGAASEEGSLTVVAFHRLDEERIGIMPMVMATLDSETPDSGLSFDPHIRDTVRTYQREIPAGVLAGIDLHYPHSVLHFNFVIT